mgnify:CR=1 FL=1
MYRVQKLLSKIGYCSRRSAELLIQSGKIQINNKTVSIGDKWSIGDTLKVNGIEIDLSNLTSQKIEVIKYYKPLGEVVSSYDPHNSKSVFDHLPKVNGKWINIGRLDLNTTGLLLFTNDGDLANHIMHPSNNLEREYIVHIDKALSKEAINNLLNGVPINNNQLGKFNQIERLEKNKYKVILTSGKKREIRNSLKYLKIKTISLHRTRYANIFLHDMKEGEYRSLTKDERSIFLI